MNISISRRALCVALFSGLIVSPGSALERDHAQLEKNKDVVERFFRIANEGKAAELNAIVREDYIEHTDMRDFRDGLAASIASNPTTPIQATYEEERHRIRGTIVRMIAERDHVWAYVAVEGPQSKVARVDMFRLLDGQIAEHWAVIQQVPEKRANTNDQFAAGRGPRDFRTQPKRISAVTNEKQAAVNRRLGREFYQYFRARDAKGLSSILAEDYIQHHPTIADRRDGLIDNLVGVWRQQQSAEDRAKAAGEPPPAAYGPVRVLVEGDQVWVFVQNSGLRGQLNQYRVANDLLVEHTGTYENLPQDRWNQNRLNNNNILGHGRGPATDFSDW